jgi:hypothetical protein
MSLRLGERIVWDTVIPQSGQSESGTRFAHHISALPWSVPCPESHMSTLPTPEERAAALVTTTRSEASGLWRICLTGLLEQPVLLDAEPNGSVVKKQAARLRQFLAAVIREARQASSGERRSQA